MAVLWGEKLFVFDCCLSQLQNATFDFFSKNRNWCKDKMIEKNLSAIETMRPQVLAQYNLFYAKNPTQIT